MEASGEGYRPDIKYRDLGGRIQQDQVTSNTSSWKPPAQPISFWQLPDSSTSLEQGQTWKAHAESLLVEFLLSYQLLWSV
jgi:hypothetical protein